MQELEKILEEIEQRVDYYKEHATLEYMDICAGLREAEGIIRKHMNDGWIPVEERLPEDRETVLCTDGECVYLVEYDADLDAPFGDMEKITDWQPSPEPYRPERRENDSKRI